tara:strand:+ start:1910 stop:2362 length:453 start_codon:yes stop_codon:yes gene_type:complete
MTKASLESLSTGDIKWMLNEIECMSLEEHSHMTGIIKNSEINYMENENGIFVKMNKLPIETIRDLYAYVLNVYESSNNFQSAIRTVTPTDECQNDTKDFEKKISLQDNKSKLTNFPIDDWKVKIIEKMRTESKIKQRKKRTPQLTNVKNN